MSIDLIVNCLFLSGTADTTDAVLLDGYLSTAELYAVLLDGYLSTTGFYAVP